jgi:hypothetical protein
MFVYLSILIIIIIIKMERVLLKNALSAKWVIGSFVFGSIGL